MWRKVACALLLPLVAGLLPACKPLREAANPTDAAELSALRTEVARLRKENADLRLSPTTLAAEVDAAMRAGNEDKATAAFKQLADTFPVSAETAEMHRRMEAFTAKKRVEDEEAKRIAALGFKALPVRATLAQDDTELTLTGAGFTRRWFFDNYGDGWRFQDAEKDRRLLVARMNVSSKRKEPALFGLGAYVADGDKLVRVGTARYRFARWSNYGAFLGTQADYRNDFTHSWRIPFTAAVPVAEADLRRGPVYLVATREGCHERHYERFGQPPVFYLPARCDSLKETLAAADFKDGSLAVLKRIE